MKRTLAVLFAAFAITSANAADPEPGKNGAAAAEQGGPKPGGEKPGATEPGLDGFQFTAGLGIIHTRSKESVISTTVDNGILRVTERQKIQNGFWLASHMFTDSCVTIDPANGKCTLHKKSRFGAFVAAQIGGGAGGGESKLVQAVALGVSYTYMTGLTVTSGSAPLVFSIGVASVPVRQLADSYEDNKALPQGSNQPVIISKNIFAPLVMVSYRFGGV